MICSCLAFSQIDPSKIDIVRDEYGVPHIYAATDAEVAYISLRKCGRRFQHYSIRLFGRIICFPITSGIMA